MQTSEHRCCRLFESFFEYFRQYCVKSSCDSTSMRRLFTKYHKKGVELRLGELFQNAPDNLNTDTLVYLAFVL